MAPCMSASPTTSFDAHIEHRTGAIIGFTKRYGLHDLVYFERHEDIRTAIQREKNIKEWPRAWKTRLVSRNNPEWRDLYGDLL